MFPFLAFSSVTAEQEECITYVTHNAVTGIDSYMSIPINPPEELKNAVLSQPGFAGTETDDSILSDSDLELGAVSPSSVIPPDNRKMITNYSSKPYSCICRIFIKWPNGEKTKGTAWLFNSTSAVTAGHCVYNKTKGGWADSITVHPGYNNGKSPYGSATAINMGTADPYIENANANYDYALLQLSSAIGSKCGWLGYTYNGGAINNTIKVIGYQKDLPVNNKGQYQYESSGTIKQVTQNRLHYDADTEEGTSGGPVMLGSTAIAVHTNGVGSTGLNKGKRIHYDMYEWMKEWH